MNTNLFQQGQFVLHSGGATRFKLECEALTFDDWRTVAHLVLKKIRPSHVYGVPTGGAAFARALEWWQGGHPEGPVLVVDDVLTTGASMEEARTLMQSQHPGAEVRGVVLFARGPCPAWVTPVFTLGEEWR